MGGGGGDFVTPYLGGSIRTFLTQSGDCKLDTFDTFIDENFNFSFVEECLLTVVGLHRNSQKIL